MEHKQLANLPDLCMLLIFDRVPIRDLQRHVPLVCERWSQLVCSSTLARRRELRINTLIRTNKTFKNYIKIKPREPRLNYMPLPLSPYPISDEHLHQAVAPFRQVRSLHVEMEHDEYNEAPPPVRPLLIHFGARLIKLELVKVQTSQIEPSLFGLLTKPNLPQLRYFTFQFRNLLNPVPEYFAFPIIRKLHKCRFELYDFSIEDLHRAVLQYVEQADRLVRCELGAQCCLDVSSLLGASALAAKRITKIEGLQSTSDISTLGKLCAHFPNQNEIDFNVLLKKLYFGINAHVNWIVE